MSDEIKDVKDIEQEENFDVFIDKYEGLTVPLQELKDDIPSFEKRISSLIKLCTIKNYKLIWIYLDIKDSKFIASLQKEDFFYHTCQRNKILLVKRLIKDAIIPTASNHTLGVGVVVINEKNELLVIKERCSNIGFKLPGGHIDDAELIQSAVKREVKEETGIEVEFESIISLGHFYPHQFDKSNLYILCTAKALSNEINIEDTQEIAECKWIDVEVYLNDEDIFDYNKKIIRAALLKEGFRVKELESLSKIPKQYELFFPKNSF